ncbi:hypothetical protein K443DRAFT_14415 [Laccaria amethystina LaAM-08-1]|uniref:Unplaced genomic scaffold K443scaffold_476, whole genome shotgun sequence n=1 Tax=Laccaria amethystina LaAM-08-1 TaxID=1095629 RepID=A0A0C9WMU5_9AGAR|nr:hypothetical protein K443DRAFT_14415 [Laccaria amethystina LaAM-08-1]
MVSQFANHKWKGMCITHHLLNHVEWKSANGLGLKSTSIIEIQGQVLRFILG